MWACVSIMCKYTNLIARISPWNTKLHETNYVTSVKLKFEMYVSYLRIIP